MNEPKHRCRLTACLITLAWIAGASPLALAQQHAHVHGAARLNVAIEADGYSLDLEMPLDSVVGFEHAPRTAAQRETARRALAQLREPAALFVASAAAGCTLAEAQVNAPALEGQAAGRDGHADLDASYRFRCRQTTALRELRVDLFSVFTRVQRLDVQLAGPVAQSGAKLTPSARTLRW